MSDREFRDITADVDALLEDPKHAPAVAAAREALAEADREYAMGLGALRQALGLTQVELAKRLEVTQPVGLDRVDCVPPLVDAQLAVGELLAGAGTL